MNKKAFDKLCATVKPGDRIFIEKNDFFSKLIKKGQSVRDKTWTHKLIHIGFVDSARKISESTIKIKLHFKKKFPFIGLTPSNGVEIRDFSAWKHHDVQKLIVQKSIGKNKLTDDQIKLISGVGYRLKAKKIFYPVAELLGTLIVYVMWSFLRFLAPEKIDIKIDKLLSKVNPLDSKKGMYCSAYVNHCFEQGAKIRLIPKGVHESVCHVGDTYNVKQNVKNIFIVGGAE